MSATVTNTVANPYVGPRTFAYEDRLIYFGREREARSLLARVVSERLLLFYAQSGAGKSSLINTRLIPGLRKEEGFGVLPVGRVGGDLPAGLEVDNIFAFNLMASLDRSGGDAQRLAGLTLADFLAGLTTEDGEHWTYDSAVGAGLAPAQDRVGAGLAPAQSAPAQDGVGAGLASAQSAPAQDGVGAGLASAQDRAGTSPAPTGARFALVIDQFEEIITGHPGRWEEREEFFRQLDRAMQANPDLWVVLTLREDYLAALDPYAPLMFNRLRARFYMERMGVDAALDAIRRPAELGERPFAPGVAEKLVDDLRQVRVPGREATISGQYVEPVQLQVVCYQLWENLGKEAEGTQRTEGAQITLTDLAAAGNVDRALTQFYEETLAAALADPEATGVSERQLRTWFDDELITEAGTRGLVRQGVGDTGGLPNQVVKALQRRFLVRGEARGGDTWIELVHDRLVEPIRASNAAWFPANLSALQRQAALWEEQGRSSDLLLRDAVLAEAGAWAASHPEELSAGEQEFLAACREAQDALEFERAALKLERRAARRMRILAVMAGVVAILAIAASIWAMNNAKLAQAQLDRQAGLALLQEAYKLKKQEDAPGAIEKLQAAQVTKTDLGIDVEAEIADVRRQVATRLVQDGEASAKSGNFAAAEAKFKGALALEPPPDTPVYVYVPAGEFLMGSSESEAPLDEQPQHSVSLDGYWIQRTEVTNAQYGRCVEAGGCESPDDGNMRYRNPQFAKQPVTGVTWDQAKAYAAWAGGRLPTEAEWEKTCRGGLEIPEDPLVGWGRTKGNDLADRPYPWGKQDPTGDLLNFWETGLGTWSAVGSYPDGASPYGALDMAGNVWEWTADWYDGEYYAREPSHNPTGPATGDWHVLRGGSLYSNTYSVRCAGRYYFSPGDRYDKYGFRVVVFPGF